MKRDLFTTHFDLILHFLIVGLLLVATLRAKYEVSSFNRSRDMKEFQNSESKSHDPFMTPFELIFIFSLEPIVINLRAKFEVSSFNRF